jgi:hypothetical protein
MKIEYRVMSIKEIVELTLNGRLNPDPIGQRPPTSQSYNKSEQIVKSALYGSGIGLITLRDISQDSEMQKTYPGVDYLVIDGGHRIRALTDFYNNKFSVAGKKIKDMKELNLSDYPICLDITVCTSQEAITKFRNLNQTTPVNPMEMLMCDDQSKICKAVRSVTRQYAEYKNERHYLFETKFDKQGLEKSEYFDMAPNHRRKWDEYVFLAFIKAAGGGNVDAGLSEFQKAIDDEYKGKNFLTKTAQERAMRFLDDIYGLAKERKPYKFNTDIFAALQVVWFGLYERNKEFSINDYEKFYKSFMRAYSLFTGNSDKTYNDKTHVFDGETYLIKEFVRKNITNFSNHKVQKECANLLINEMLSDDNDVDSIGVIFCDTKRSLTTAEREQHLAIQGYVCAIDGLPLRLEDSVWGHDTPWAKGGSLHDGAVIRRTHNTDMGSTTLDEYRMILEIRKKKTA